RRLVSASGNAVALWDLDQLARSARWAPTVLPAACNGCSAPDVAFSPEGAFAALAPDLDSSLTVTGLAPGDAGASPQVVTGLTDRTGLRWTDAATLEVTVAKPTEVEVHDGGASGPLLASAASATAPATLRG